MTAACAPELRNLFIACSFSQPVRVQNVRSESTSSRPPANPAAWTTCRWARKVRQTNAGRYQIDRTRRRVTDAIIRLFYRPVDKLAFGPFRTVPLPLYGSDRH